MLFATLVLVSVNSEHDGLEEGIDLGHGDQAAQVGNVTRFGLQEEQKVAVFLGSFIIREESLLWVGGVIEVARDFVLLEENECVSKNVIEPSTSWRRMVSPTGKAYLFQRHSVLNQQGDSRIQVSHILFQDEILL